MRNPYKIRSKKKVVIDVTKEYKFAYTMFMVEAVICLIMAGFLLWFSVGKAIAGEHHTRGHRIHGYVLVCPDYHNWHHIHHCYYRRT